jgi:hypothetical protein
LTSEDKLRIAQLIEDIDIPDWADQPHPQAPGPLVAARRRARALPSQQNASDGEPENPTLIEALSPPRPRSPSLRTRTHSPSPGQPLSLHDLDTGASAAGQSSGILDHANKPSLTPSRTRSPEPNRARSPVARASSPLRSKPSSSARSPTRTTQVSASPLRDRSATSMQVSMSPLVEKERSPARISSSPTRPLIHGSGEENRSPQPASSNSGTRDLEIRSPSPVRSTASLSMEVSEAVGPNSTISTTGTPTSCTSLE